LRPHLIHIFLRLLENIDAILTVEFSEKPYFLLNSMGNLGMSMRYRSRPSLTHNPKVRGPNPSPATKEFKGLFDVASPFSLGCACFGATSCLLRHANDRDLTSLSRVCRFSFLKGSYMKQQKAKKRCSWERFPGVQKWFALGETIAHLEYLEACGSTTSSEHKNKFLFSLR
jgi:hypothetical protein